MAEQTTQDMSITIDAKKYMKFDDMYKIFEFEEDSVVFTINIDSAWDGYTFRMEIENKKAENQKDIVYLETGSKITIPVNMLVKGLLKLQGVFIKSSTSEDGETTEYIVAKTNRIMTTVNESINADSYLAEAYSNIIQMMRDKYFADVAYNANEDNLDFFDIEGSLLKQVGLSIGGLTHEVTDDLDD